MKFVDSIIATFPNLKVLILVVPTRLPSFHPLLKSVGYFLLRRRALHTSSHLETRQALRLARNRFRAREVALAGARE
jgi:hypothetical protein